MQWSDRLDAPPNSHPSGDGRPFSETDFHFRVMVDLLQILDDRYENDPNVYVAGNLLVYYEKGNKRRRIAPDVFVVFGVPKLIRRNYLLWEEGRGPAVVIEVTSRRTRWEDTHRKFKLYRDVLKVSEYFLFDPLGHYLDPRLQGYRLSAGQYKPMRLQNGRLRSRQLDLWLEPDGDSLRLVDPERGRWLPTRAEIIQSAEQAERAAADLARTEAAARQRAEAEVERLRAELAAVRGRPAGRNGH